jgi:hypothetical protein
LNTGEERSLKKEMGEVLSAQGKEMGEIKSNLAALSARMAVIMEDPGRTSLPLVGTCGSRVNPQRL